MLDAPSTLPYHTQPETRHHFGSTRRAYHKNLTLFEHLAFQSGTLVILALAIVLGLLVSSYCWLLLLLVIPYVGMYFSLLEKDRRMHELATALSPRAHPAEHPPPPKASTPRPQEASSKPTVTQEGGDTA